MKGGGGGQKSQKFCRHLMYMPPWQGFLFARSCSLWLRPESRGVWHVHGFLTLSSRGRGEVQKLPKFANSSTDRLREMQTKGEGLKSQKFCERDKWIAPNRPDYWKNETS